MAFQKPVLIVGGGLSGLTLAHSLKKQGIPYKLFERDSAEDARSMQGWSISLHFCLPLLAKTMDPDYLKTLPTETSVNPEAPDEIQFAFVDGVTGKVLVLYDPKEMLPPGVSSAMFRINRKRFRQWLLKDIDVVYDKRLASYQINDDNNGGVTVTFTDGTTEHGSVLVGADGVNSAVCQQMMTKDKFEKATQLNPVRPLVVTRWLTAEEYQPLRRYSKTQFSAFGSLARNTDRQEHITCFVSLNDICPDSEKKYQVIISLARYDENNVLPWYEDNKDRMKQLKEWAKEGLEGDFQKIILEINEDDQVTPLRIRERAPPRDSLAQHQGRITLIGDAAHTMTMFRAEGGNHAIFDAALLGEQLGEAFRGNISLTEAIEKYHEEMIPRGIKAVEDSHQAAYMSHKSPETMLKLMQKMVKQAQERVKKQAQERVEKQA